MDIVRKKLLNNTYMTLNIFYNKFDKFSFDYF